MLKKKASYEKGVRDTLNELAAAAEAWYQTYEYEQSELCKMKKSEKRDSEALKEARPQCLDEAHDTQFWFQVHDTLHVLL